MNKIRVLHCIETVYSGGVEKRRLELAKYFNNKNFALKIICTWAGGPILESFRELGVELIQVGGFSHPFEIFKHKKVLKVIKEFKPHIIHGAIFEGMSMAAIGGKLGKVPIIILEETSHPISRSKKAIYLQKLFAIASDRVIGIAPSVVKFLKEKVGIPDSKVCLINNGVSEPHLVSEAEILKLKAELRITESDFVIGSAGRLFNDVKRFSDILEAMKLLDNTNVKFVLLGHGKDLDLLKSKAVELGLESQFFPVGYQNNTSPYFSLFDIFCLASAHEGFGLVVAEAMLHKLPVIATKVGGLADVVVDNKTGFLVPPFNPNAIAEKLNVLIEDKTLRHTLGNAGFLRAKEHYTADHYCRQIEKLYISLLKAKGIAHSQTS